MSHLSQQPVAFPSEDRRTALIWCLPIAVTTTFVALEYALQAVALCFDGVPLRLMHQVIQLCLLLSFHPFAPQTSELYSHSFLAGLLLVVLLTIVGGSCYALLSVGEDMIRVLASPHFSARYLRRRLFPRKVLFHITLPVGVPSLDDMLSPPAVAASTSSPDSMIIETIHPELPGRQEAPLETEVVPLPSLKRVHFSLLNEFAIQLEKSDTVRILIDITNSRWKALFARMLTIARGQGMRSQAIFHPVSPSTSLHPQWWYYTTKDRINDFFKDRMRQEGIAEFKVIQKRGGSWHLFDERVEIIIDLDEFERQCKSILQASLHEDVDTMIQAGHELIAFYGRGYLPELVHEEGFEEWGEKKRTEYNEMYQQALSYAAKYVEAAGQQQQSKRLLTEAAQFSLERALAASDTFEGAENRGEPALQKCLELYMSTNDIPEAKNAYYRFEKHITDHLCDVWEPSRETQKVWEKVRGKQAE